MFFFKQKQIVVDCFTDDPGAFNYHPIAKANEFYPTWWKQLAAQFESVEDHGMIFQRSTIKKCDGITQLYKKGYILPLWNSLRIKTHEDTYNFTFARYPVNKNLPMVECHNDKQYGDTFKDRLHMKVISPWFLKQSKYCEFAMQPMIWGTQEHWTNFTILPGVVDFKFQHWTHVNMFLQKNKDILIDAGTPMYHIIPLTEHEVVFKNHLVGSEEINKLYYSRFGTFTDSYKNIKRQFKEKINQCPFGHK